MKTMLITGASRGIGAATAVLAASKGYAVAVNYHKRRNAAEAVVQQITAAGGKAAAFQADVSKEDEIRRLFADVANFGELACLVNNAGILETQMPLVKMDASRMRRVFDVNVIGPMLCCQEAIQRMSLKHGGKGGSIVNVSSVASRTGSPFEYTDYAATKGAIDTLTIGLSKEVAEDGIRVNAVRPGFIHTDIHAAGGEPDRINRLIPTIPLRRGGQPEEVAEAICWLASDAASYSTGIFIDVTGGR